MQSEQQVQQPSYFSLEDRVAPLGLVSLEGAEELTEKIDAHLVRWAQRAGMQVDTFQIKSSCPRFNSGDAKGILNQTVRGYDLFIVVDVGNYSRTYPYFGFENHMSPDDHFQNLKRIIQAASGKPRRINVIMPTLYGGRQHRRNYRESLDGAFALQELRSMGVKNVLTFDAHDPRVQNAVPLMGFDNLMPSYQVLKKMFRSFPDLVIDRDSFMVISPDEGALDRNMFYASVMGVEMGMFYKRRDYSRIVDGRNPIVAHEYLGTDVKDKDVFVADDIISSGESMLDIAYNVKERGARRFFAFATFAIFAKGLERFEQAYKEGVLDGVFGTNLTYRAEELKNRPWFYEVDMSKYIACYVSALNHDMAISRLIDPHEKITVLLEKRREEARKNQHEQLTF